MVFEIHEQNIKTRPEPSLGKREEAQHYFVTLMIPYRLGLQLSALKDWFDYLIHSGNWSAKASSFCQGSMKWEWLFVLMTLFYDYDYSPSTSSPALAWKTLGAMADFTYATHPQRQPCSVNYGRCKIGSVC